MITYKIAIYHYQTNKWKYYLPNNMICNRIKSGKSVQFFEFDDNKDIYFQFEGKTTPFLVERSNKNNKIEITSQKASQYNQYWKSITIILQL